VLAIAETVTVLRAGRIIERLLPAAGIDPARLAADIVGDAPIPTRATASAPHALGTALVMDGVRSRPDRDGPMLDGVDLHVARGEIVGVAGVENNGQLALVRTIAGLLSTTAGRVALGDRDVTAASPLDRRARGVRIIPFERNVEGLSLGSSLWENWSVRGLLRGNALRTIDRTRLRADSRAAFERWDVRFTSVEQHARSLSGGNAQKIILAREIDDDAGLIIAAQPTRGLDVGATAFVWSALREARAAGRGILLISSDLDELFDVCDRVVVICGGRIAGTFAPPYDVAAVGAAMMAAAG
jgi:simple sugar transport system ATP-binding protein